MMNMTKNLFEKKTKIPLKNRFYIVHNIIACDFSMWGWARDSSSEYSPQKMHVASDESGLSAAAFDEN